MKQVTLHLTFLLFLLAGVAGEAQSQLSFQTKWMAAGSLRNWFANTGCEIEEGRITEQQDGLIWPAFYGHQDMQAAKGLWIGCADFTDEKGAQWPTKIAHVGPRPTGQGEVFPMSFEMVAKFPPTNVLVDGNPQLIDENSAVDRVDPTIVPDRQLTNVVNTVTGITMKRTIMQFSQGYHDNYMVYDYVFTNTGNTNDDATIELPSATLTGVYFYYEYRWAVNADVRYVIGTNAVGWGINTMNDVRGDGVKNDADNPDGFRASFAWHGKYPVFTAYDNIGGPIWIPYYDASDTIGRLGAPQFVGLVTLHADKSAVDRTDDPAQPSTTDWVDSDAGLNRNNSAVNIGQMNAEYAWMSKGHANPRHADAVQPDGNFITGQNDPTLGKTGGGFSTAIGYGPYTLKHGDSIHIVQAECAAGLSREQCIDLGRQFKHGQITTLQKNTAVFTGKDSLFQTFRRAIANYKSGYNLPQAPLPPASFSVTQGGDKVSLTWEVQTSATNPPPTGFRIYRATGRGDTIYSLIATMGATDRSYDDTQIPRGPDNYYYIQAVGPDRPADAVTLTPAGPLLSNRAFATTGGISGQGAQLKRQAGTASSQIRIVPNPWSLGADLRALRWGFSQPDVVKFLDIPGYCTIRIYTELGELIQTIQHADGSGDESWDSRTTSGQTVVSGIYIVVFENTKTGERTIKKLSVIR